MTPVPFFARVPFSAPQKSDAGNPGARLLELVQAEFGLANRIKTIWILRQIFI